MQLSSVSLSLNSYPFYFAKLTKASSSGEAALYVPFFASITIVWQQARKTKTLMSAYFSISSFPLKIVSKLGSWKLTFDSCGSSFPGSISVP